MPDIIPDLSSDILSRGLASLGISDSINAGLLTGGLSSAPLTQAIAPSVAETYKTVIAAPGGNFQIYDGLDALSRTIVLNAYGHSVPPSPLGTVAIGSGATLDFDPSTLQGRITPALATNVLNGMSLAFDDEGISYTGQDLRILLEVLKPSSTGLPRLAKQLIECTSLSISDYRATTQVRAGGFINPKGYALGGRTIGGTLVVTEFTTSVMLRFLQSVLMNEVSQDTTYSKIDQLPPFNMTLLFCNEQGFVSFRRLLGVVFLKNGTVYSIQDQYSERTMTYMALDYTELMPLTLSSLYKANPSASPAMRKLGTRTPTDVMTALNQNTQIQNYFGPVSSANILGSGPASTDNSGSTITGDLSGA